MPDIPVPFSLKVKKWELLQVRQNINKNKLPMSVSRLLGLLSDWA